MEPGHRSRLSLHAAATQFAVPRPALLQQGRVALPLAQLTGRCHRLQEELATACDAFPVHPARIHRLLEDLSSTECDIAAIRAVDEESLGSAALRRTTE